MYAALATLCCERPLTFSSHCNLKARTASRHQQTLKGTVLVFIYNSSFANKFINLLVYQLGAPGVPAALGLAGGSCGISGGYGKNKINTATSCISPQSEIFLIHCVIL